MKASIFFIWSTVTLSWIQMFKLKYFPVSLDITYIEGTADWWFDSIRIVKFHCLMLITGSDCFPLILFITKTLRHRSSVRSSLWASILLIILTLLCLEINDLISLKLLKSSNTDGTTYWQCTDCHYKSSHKATIKRHVESKHLEAVYQCDLCQHQVSTKHQLNAHRSLKHGTKYIPY